MECDTGALLPAWPCHGHDMAMGIERKNSFHLLLSDEELKLLRLLAERDGLNPSDYLRSILRQMAGTPPHLMQALRLGAALGATGLAEVFERHSSVSKGEPKKPKGK
jgi:hypothetical protein